jgi:hypothetical protein
MRDGRVPRRRSQNALQLVAERHALGWRELVQLRSAKKDNLTLPNGNSATGRGALLSNGFKYARKVVFSNGHLKRDGHYH